MFRKWRQISTPFILNAEVADARRCGGEARASAPAVDEDGGGGAVEAEVVKKPMK